jgi:hypothetical protein
VRVDGETVAVVTLLSCRRTYGSADRTFASELVDWIALGLQGRRARKAEALVGSTRSTMREYLRAPPAVRVSSLPPRRVDVGGAITDDITRAIDTLAAAADRLASSSVLEPIEPSGVRALAEEARRISNATRDLVDWIALEGEAPPSLSLRPIELPALASRIAARAAVARQLRIEIVGSGTLIADAQLLPNALAHLARAAAVGTSGEITLRAELTADELVVDVFARKRVTPDPLESDRPAELSMAVAQRVLAAHGGTLDARATSLRATIPRALTDKERSTSVRRRTLGAP